jgi:hypothetical protein
MNWEQASERVIKKITVGLDINTEESTYREIIQTPPYECTTKAYNSEIGFRVKIGNASSIDIPLSMLKVLYNYSFNKNSRLYDTAVFQICYPKQRENHGCYVHSVGQIFVKAGIASDLGKKYKVF